MDYRTDPTVPSIARRVAAALGAVAVAFALGAPAAADELPPPPAVSAVPIPPGQVAAAVGQLDGLAAGLMRQTGVPGMSIAVVHDDEVVYAKGFGVRNTAGGRPVDANTVFQLASLSKPLGATAISRAIGRRARWTDPVARHLPGFRLASRYASRNVTLADMYSHRSGLPDHAGDLLEDLGYGRREVLRRLRFYPLSPLRTEYAYTNFGLTAAAVAAARAEGMSWPRLSERQLYRPLGMTSTSSTFAGYRGAPNRADLHVEVDGAWKARYRRNPDAQSPAGGASSSAADMAKWLRLMLADGVYDGRRVVPAPALATMRTPHMLSGPPATPASRSAFYGLGIGISDDSSGRVRLNHSGAFALGAGTTVTLVPSARLGIVVLTNGQPIGVAEAVAATFVDLATLGRAERDWFPAYNGLMRTLLDNGSVLAGRERPARPRPARRRAAYLGSYANRLYGPATVAVRRGRLVLRLGPGRRAFPLRHWSGDTFSYHPAGENATGVAAVTFRGGRQRAAALRVENLDEEGLGTFRRR
jgi:CubicO group peptidase (beta-lactamase class C family)